MLLSKINQIICRLPANRRALTLICCAADGWILAWTAPIWEIHHA
jgi:hypothetical protein